MISFGEGVEDGKGKDSHLIRRKVIERSVSFGRLEIGNLKIHKTLLARWLWCFSAEPYSLWCRIIVSKHGSIPNKTFGKTFRKSSPTLFPGLVGEGNVLLERSLGWGESPLGDFSPIATSVFA